jgi:hypothetical protein
MAIVLCLAALTRDAHAGDYGSSLEIGAASRELGPTVTDWFVQGTYRHAPVTPGMAGLDFSLSVWAPAHVIVLPELDLGGGIPVGRNVFLAPRIGATVMLSGAGAYSSAFPGVNAGLGLVVLGERGDGMRFDVSVRHFAAFEEREDFWSASVGRVFGPS